MNKKAFYLIFFLLCIGLSANAQVDDSKGKIKKGTKKSIIAVPSKKVKKPTVLESKDKKSGFKKVGVATIRNKKVIDMKLSIEC